MIKKVFLLYSILFITSCSTDEGASLSDNGFVTGGTFYDTALTNEIKVSYGNNGGSMAFEFSDDANPTGLQSRGHFAYFHVEVGDFSSPDDLKRTYEVEYYNTPFSVSYQAPWGFRNLYEQETFISGGNYNDRDRLVATIIINDIDYQFDYTTNLGRDYYQVTYIDMDYTFKADGTTVRGKFVGPVVDGIMD